jgi:hypothetical protein
MRISTSRASVIPRYRMPRSAVPAEFEPHHPLAGILPGWGESPFSGGVGGQAGEILARHGAFQRLAHDSSRAINAHKNRNLDVAMNRVTRAARNIRDLFVNDR